MNSKSSIPNFNNTSSNNNLFTNNIHNHGENLQNNDYEPHYTNSKNQLLHSESYKNKNMRSSINNNTDLQSNVGSNDCNNNNNNNNNNINNNSLNVELLEKQLSEIERTKKEVSKYLDTIKAERGNLDNKSSSNYEISKLLQENQTLKSDNIIFREDINRLSELNARLEDDLIRQRNRK